MFQGMFSTIPICDLHSFCFKFCNSRFLENQTNSFPDTFAFLSILGRVCQPSFFFTQNIPEKKKPEIWKRAFSSKQVCCKFSPNHLIFINFGSQIGPMLKHIHVSKELSAARLPVGVHNNKIYLYTWTAPKKFYKLFWFWWR